MKTYFVPLLVTQVHTVVAPDLSDAIDIAMDEAECHEGTAPTLCNVDLKALNSSLTEEDEVLIEDILEQSEHHITMFEEE